MENLKYHSTEDGLLSLGNGEPQVLLEQKNNKYKDML